MNNRILKKLCKRVKELIEQNPHIQPRFWRTKDVWLDCEEPIMLKIRVGGQRQNGKTGAESFAPTRSYCQGVSDA